jgi:N-acetylneuraminic acid mutarotase
MKNILLSAFASICLIFSSNAQYTWTQKASMSLLRYGASSFTIGNYSYVGTGYNVSSSPLSDWWRFDPSTNTWSQMASMTGPRSAAIAFAINGKGYCGLGLSAAGHLTDFHEYNPGTNSWATKASLPAQGRYGCSSFAIGNTGYASCGNLGSASGPYSNQVFGYDATTNTWTSKAAFPGMARYGGRGATINNKGYAFGGINGTGTSSSSFFNDLWEYDATNNTWLQRMGISGNGRQYPSVFVLDNKLICGNGIHWTGFMETFEAYDPNTNSWSAVPSMPASEARWAAGTFTNGNSGYVATGNKSFNNPVVVENDLWELSISTALNNDPDENNIQFQVIPQIGSGIIEVNVNSANHSAYSLILYNLNGQKIAEQLIRNGATTIRSDIASGIYIATLTGSKGNALKTIKFFAGK